jgi:hypothetical protein
LGTIDTVSVFFESGQKILVENLATVSKPRCPTDRLRIANTRLTWVNLGFRQLRISGQIFSLSRTIDIS